MKLGTFAVSAPTGRSARLGALSAEGIVDVTAARIAVLERDHVHAVARRLAGAQTPPDMIKLLEGGHRALDWAREALEHVEAAGVDRLPDGTRVLYDEADVTLLAPVPRPPGIACFTTWPEHIADSAGKGYGVAFPDAGSELRPYYKGNPDSVAGPGTALTLPALGTELDIECELAAVVLGTAKDLSVAEAEQAIAGYCVFNDVSIRDVQIREMAFGLGPTKGKDQDGGNVLGPWLTTYDEVGDPARLVMSVSVNGTEWGSHGVGRMEWGFPELLSYLSRGQTVHPGHIVTSGCFPGGSALDLGRRLADGDEVTLAVSGVGELRQVVRSAAPDGRDPSLTARV